jgi:hypothetical protein
MDLREEYTCDSCSTPFRVSGRVQFFVEEIQDKNFKMDYKTKISTPELFLSEA